jgi:pimeloyl-ACP methyl ester carboxylesterase
VIVDGIGGPVDVLAHSHGAICALEASRLAKNLRRLPDQTHVAIDAAPELFAREVLAFLTA